MAELSLFIGVVNMRPVHRRRGGQAMAETLVVAAVVVLVLLTFGEVFQIFLDYAYRTLQLIAMPYP
ncbi:MAG: hypothetical protein PHV34_17760 [Verrucomicrobiae bacterium]|nr:hypothetical protein [Verrucomicrobiae bacterium]